MLVFCGILNWELLLLIENAKYMVMLPTNEIRSICAVASNHLWTHAVTRKHWSTKQVLVVERIVFIKKLKEPFARVLNPECIAPRIFKNTRPKKKTLFVLHIALCVCVVVETYLQCYWFYGINLPNCQLNKPKWALRYIQIPDPLSSLHLFAHLHIAQINICSFCLWLKATLNRLSN